MSVTVKSCSGGLECGRHGAVKKILPDTLGPRPTLSSVGIFGGRRICPDPLPYPPQLVQPDVDLKLAVFDRPNSLFFDLPHLAGQASLLQWQPPKPFESLNPFSISVVTVSIGSLNSVNRSAVSTPA